MSIAHITTAYRGGYENRPGWWFALAGHRLMAGVDQIKREIPSSARSWDPERKLWWVADEYALRLGQIIPEFEAFRLQPAMPGIESQA